jgi:tetratricopeptide (TPR) repeat protein
VYVRRAGGEESLARAERFYRERGVPFEPSRGLEPERVLREAPAFARAWRLWPQDGEALRRAAASEPRAGETLAQAAACVGAWDAALAAAREALSLDPASRPARLALVYALLRTGRGEEAAEEALPLVRLEPGEPRGRLALTLARRAAADAGPDELATLLLRYPLLDDAQTHALLAHYGSASLRRGAAGGLAAWP